MLETRDVPGATELEAPSRRPPIRGVNETPRNTRPRPAVRIVRKLSPVAGRAAFSGSVISTSLFGSAPWSPPPLAVEMMAQIVLAETSRFARHDRLWTYLGPVD